VAGLRAGARQANAVNPDRFGATRGSGSNIDRRGRVLFVRPQAGVDRSTPIRTGAAKAAIAAGIVVAASLTAMAARSPGTIGAAVKKTARAESSREDIDPRKQLALAKATGEPAVDALIDSLEKAVHHNPTKVDFWDGLGRAWVRKARDTADPGYYLNANACSEIALSIDATDRAAFDLQALVLLNQHRFEEARAVAQRITDGNPRDPLAYANLSDALLELGRFDEAARAAQKMMDLKPNLPSYSRASYLRWLQGDDEGAKANARLAIDSGSDARDPEPRAWVTVQAAMLFWHEGDYDGADAGFDRALEGVREYAPALVGKGRVALARGDARRATEMFQRAHAASPLVETSWLLGDALEAAGDAAGAKRAYAQVEKEGASDKRTLSAFYSTKSIKPTEALALALEEKKTRGDIVIDDTLAWALYRNGRFSEAKTAIDRALAHGTKDARLLFHTGAISVALGDKATGVNLIAAALARNPKFDVDGAQQAAAMLQTLRSN
jgi:tetratricopeptide (TPR) repeat protein